MLRYLNFICLFFYISLEAQQDSSKFEQNWNQYILPKLKEAEIVPTPKDENIKLFQRVKDQSTDRKLTSNSLASISELLTKLNKDATKAFQNTNLPQNKNAILIQKPITAKEAELQSQKTPFPEIKILELTNQVSNILIKASNSDAAKLALNPMTQDYENHLEARAEIMRLNSIQALLIGAKEECGFQIQKENQNLREFQISGIDLSQMDAMSLSTNDKEIYFFKKDQGAETKIIILEKYKSNQKIHTSIYTLIDESKIKKPTLLKVEPNQSILIGGTNAFYNYENELSKDRFLIFEAGAQVTGKMMDRHLPYVGGVFIPQQLTIAKATAT